MMESGIRNTTRLAVLVAALLFALVPAAKASDFYGQTNLVADQSGANHTDAQLVNAWGIVMTPTSPIWISDNGSGFSTVYDGNGVAVGAPLVVQVPAPPTAPAGTNAKPTGVVANPGTTGFNVTGAVSGVTASSRFIFATEDGVIAGWAPTADATHAIIGKDNSGSGAIYKGLAIGANGTGAVLYATDFHNGKVDVFDAAFAAATLAPGAFTDPAIPPGYAPFGIQAINGNIYVTYARQDADREDDVPGNGNGYVDVYDPDGNLIDRVASKGKLNSPWGLALAPAGFGKFANMLLVGNFGDGAINAFDIATGKSKGQLKGADHRALKIGGLWGLAFGNGFNNAPVNTLFFTAGPGGEEHGLFGRLDVLPGTALDGTGDDI